MPPGTSRAWPPRWRLQKIPSSWPHSGAFLRTAGLLKGHTGAEVGANSANWSDQEKIPVFIVAKGIHYYEYSRNHLNAVRLRRLELSGCDRIHHGSVCRIVILYINIEHSQINSVNVVLGKERLFFLPQLKSGLPIVYRSMLRPASLHQRASNIT